MVPPEHLLGDDDGPRHAHPVLPAIVLSACPGRHIAGFATPEREGILLGTSAEETRYTHRIKRSAAEILKDALEITPGERAGIAARSLEASTTPSMTMPTRRGRRRSRSTRPRLTRRGRTGALGRGPPPSLGAMMPTHVRIHPAAAEEATPMQPACSLSEVDPIHRIPNCSASKLCETLTPPRTGG